MNRHYAVQEVSQALINHMGKDVLLKLIRQTNQIPDEAELTEIPFKLVDTGEDFLTKIYCQPEEAVHWEFAYSWVTEKGETK